MCVRGCRDAYVKPVERLMPARRALKRAASMAMWISLANMERVAIPTWYQHDYEMFTC
jgi:hypothetical protein